MKKVKSSSKKSPSRLSFLSGRRKYAVFAVLASALVGTLLLGMSFAGTGQLVLSPSRAQVAKGSTITIDVVINPGTAVDGVEASILYDQTKLEFVSIDSSSSAFPVTLAESGGSGNVSIIRGILGGSVDQPNSHVAKVTFKSLANRGSTTLSLNGNATFQGAYTDPGGSTSSISFTKPTGGTKTPRTKTR